MVTKSPPRTAEAFVLEEKLVNNKRTTIRRTVLIARHWEIVVKTFSDGIGCLLQENINSILLEDEISFNEDVKIQKGCKELHKLTVVLNVI